MTVVYIDSVFLLNALMDAIVLLATAHLGGIPVKRKRCFTAAVLGGCYSAAVFLPGGSSLATLPGKLMAGVLLTLVAFAGERRILRLTLLFFAVSCGMAGCVMALGMVAGGVPMENGVFYTNVDAGVLLIVSSAAYGVLTAVFRASAGTRLKGLLVPVTLVWEERRVRLTALCDTGNALRDPATGRPVLVAEGVRLRELFPAELRPLLTMDALRSPADLLGRLGERRMRFRLIPYHAVGVAGGMLMTVRTDWGEVGGKRYDRLVVALSPTDLGDGFTALWGEWEGSGEYENHHGVSASAAGKTGSYAAADHLLHLRK